MKAFRLLLIAALIAAGFAFFPARDIVSAECINISGGDAYFDTWGPYSMSAGTVIDVTMNTEASNGTYVGIYHNGAWVVENYYVGPITFSYKLPSDANDVHISLAFQYYFASNSFTIRSSCTGRDMIPIPPQAVVGQFVTNTELLSAPDANAGTGIVMEIGKTLWVFGVDSSGMYYQVAMSGSLLWVPVSSMGPNYDDVWNGTPLPSTVVN